MKIAIEGCAHGELDKIYECIETLQDRESIKIDLLICCGDFQSVRNNEDMRAMAVPDKYQHICTFYKYYSGEKQAPILTLFIGGNHEASNYLQELPFGGWVAPNIYYMGRAGVINFGNLRIGGLSGIYKRHDYLQGLWEAPPYTQQSLRTVYHVRSLDVFRMSQLKEKVNVMLSHDWPRGITDYGDKEHLLKRKPFFKEDIESNQLGSIPAERLLHTLKPEYWFAAHLHCQFAAIVNHEDNQTTKFLALDKCLPKRRHLQILELPTEYDGDKSLKLDAEWLAVLRSTNHLLSVKNMDCHMPGPGGNERYVFTPTEEEKEAVVNILQDLKITHDSFVKTAPIYDPRAPKRAPSNPILNPQTAKLCEKLGIDDPVQVVLARLGRVMSQPCMETLPSVPELVPSENVVTKTPMKTTKLFLPAPSTPSQHEDDDSQKNVIFSPGSSFVSDNADSVNESTTPLSASKKTFKRRNMSLYNTPDGDDSVSTESSCILDDSPRSSKLPFIGNKL
ncbi:lariat debranching enzyme [Plodia interpunctella]|uniref:lariat debranching enzyme n=1 Tax=Plodia interpunctella TaxID=58824 RepID=UPI002368A545|nr:lariat debranching enzyme [Plodia interpunctella]